MLFLKEKELKRISESPTFSAISSYSHPPSFLWTEIAYLPYQNAQLRELTQPAKKGLILARKYQLCWAEIDHFWPLIDFKVSYFDV